MDFQIKQFLEQVQKAERFEHIDCQCLELWLYCNQKDKKLKVQENSESLRGTIALIEWLEKKSLALSHDPETGMTTGILRAVGKTDEEALIKHLRKPERAINVDGMVKYSEKLERQLDVDTALEYLKSSAPCTSVDAVLKTLKGFGRQLDVYNIDEYFKVCGFRVASDAPSKDSDKSGLEIDVDAVIRCQKSLGLHYDLDIISKQLDAFRPKIDIKAILKHLIASEEQVLHPMLLPTIMYQSLKVSSENHSNVLHRDIVNIERVLRHVKVRREVAPSDGPVEDQEIRDEELDYQSLSRQLNTCKKDQASRDGRHQFREQFQTHLEKALKGVKKSSARSPTNALARERSTRILKIGNELEQWVSFNSRIFEFEEGRDVNYRARIKAQLNLV
ncbi:MAG: hypothetical protein LQ351_000655 [Letrouitia transgressa]|nr:MAG: hypothetical protein LQ351_000655 [Letrouitia transgressa]